MDVHSGPFEGPNTLDLQHRGSGPEMVNGVLKEPLKPAPSPNVLDSERLCELFSQGVDAERYTEFCSLFSKVVFSDEDRSEAKGPSDFPLPGEASPTFEEDEEFEQSADLEPLFWHCLEWFLSVLDDLNRYEALGFGTPFLLNAMKALTDDLKERSEGESPTNSELQDLVEKIKTWVDFISVFRDANNSIYTTYTLLDMMENKLSHIRYKSIKILQLKQNNMARFTSSNMSVSTPLSTSIDNLDATPNTPSSVLTMSSDRGDKDLLNDVWDDKLGQLHQRIFSRFRWYLVGIVRDLKALQPNLDYSDLLHLVLYTRKSHKPKRSQLPDPGASPAPNEDIGSPGTLTLEDQKEGEDILDYLNRYYSARNMTEEKAESYVNRIIDLNKRLIPKFVKIVTRLPIYYEAYLNALICPNVQDGLFHLVTSNTNFKDTHKDRGPFKEGKGYKEERVDHKDWLHKIDLVKLLSRAGLEVVEVARCSIGSDRKVVVFTQGTLRDLFTNATYRDSYRDYKESYKELYKDSLIKNDKDNKLDHEDDEILNSIYYCDGNLFQVASREIEKLLLQNMPTFKWMPKLVKHQHSQLSRQTCSGYTNRLDVEDLDLGGLDSNGAEFIEYVKLEERIWANRLGVFSRINERNIRNFLLRRNNNAVQPLRYDSSTLLVNYNVPFKVLLDYNNYIPIKYIYNSGAAEGEAGGGGGKKRDDEDNDWLIRLFNSSNTRMFKNSCIDIEIDRDLFPGLYQFNNHNLNCFVMPIHAQSPEKSEAFVKFSKVLQSKIDLLYSSYLQQVSRALAGTDPSAPPFGGEYGDFFVTYHTNLFIGNRDKMVVNFVFHLVCCDTTPNDDVDPVEYAEDTEVILKHMQKMQPTLAGLARILEVCNQLNVDTIHIPASLKCCYKINHYSGSTIQTEFHHTVTNYSYLNTQLDAQLGGGANAHTNDVFECNTDYVRCLAVVSYLASLLNKNRYSIRNFNLVFPQHLKQTLLPKTAANIFATRVNTF